MVAGPNVLEREGGEDLTALDWPEFIEAHAIDVDPEHLPPELVAWGIQDKVKILGLREGGYVDCFVRFGDIDNEEVPVTEEYALQLAEQMQAVADEAGGTGQTTPISLGYIEGETLLKIKDGFHRNEGLRVKGDQFVYATIEVTDWDKLYDDRIFTAKNHRQVRFSRVVQWIREIWDRSTLSQLEFSEGLTLSVSEAVNLYNKDLKAQSSDLSEQDIEEVKQWVARKEKQWGLSAVTIYSYLFIADHVDPVLVQNAREQKRKSVLTAPTQSMLRTFSVELPDQYELQNLVMDKAINVRIPRPDGGVRSLTTPEFRALCKVVQGSKSRAEAEIRIDGIDWSSLKPEYQRTKKKVIELSHDALASGADALADSEEEIAAVLAALEKAIYDGDELSPSQERNLEDARAKAFRLLADVGGIIMAANILLDEVQDEHPAPILSDQVLSEPEEVGLLEDTVAADEHRDEEAHQADDSHEEVGTKQTDLQDAGSGDQPAGVTKQDHSDQSAPSHPRPKPPSRPRQFRPAPVTVGSLVEISKDKARILEEEGLDIIVNQGLQEPFDQDELRHTISLFLAGDIELSDVPRPITATQKRQFQVALKSHTKSVDKTTPHFEERFAELRILQNPELAGVSIQAKESTIGHRGPRT